MTTTLRRRFTAYLVGSFLVSTLAFAHFHQQPTVHFNRPVNVHVSPETP